MSTDKTSLLPSMDIGTRLSFQRTYLAVERTQLAWVRTGLSLITFGFTIAKFFDYLRQQRSDAGTLFGPSAVGIFMIGLGVATLGLSAAQHLVASKTMRSQCPDLPPSLTTIVSALLAAIGTLALIGALIRF